MRFASSIVSLPWQGGTIPLDPTESPSEQRIYRYEIRAGELDRAWAVGDEVDLLIEVTTRDESGCESRTTVGVRETVAGLPLSR